MQTSKKLSQHLIVMLYRYWQWTPTEQSKKHVYTSTLQAGQYQPSQSPTGTGHLLAVDT